MMGQKSEDMRKYEEKSEKMERSLETFSIKIKSLEKYVSLSEPQIDLIVYFMTFYISISIALYKKLFSLIFERIEFLNLHMAFREKNWVLELIIRL